MPHIIKRYQTYYAHLIVPKDARKTLGRSKFSKSLKTDSRREALKRAQPIIIYWKQLIDKARGNDISAQASIFREVLTQLHSPQEIEDMKGLILDHTYSIEQKSGEEKAKEFHEIAVGHTTMIADLVEPYLAQQDLVQHTEKQRRSDLTLLQKRFKTVEQVNRKEAGKFVSEVLAPTRKPRTVNKMLTTYHSFWQWLKDRGYYPENQPLPWERQRLKVKKGDETIRRPFTDDEARKMFALVGSKMGRKHQDDLDALKVMAVTGMRGGEVVHLRQANISEKAGVIWLDITQAKTKAGIRRVPVVDQEVQEIIKSRLNGDAGGWLFKHFGNPKHGNRYAQYGLRLRDRLRLITEDTELVAGHGWRHRAQTLLEHAGIDPWVAEALIGHERAGIGLTVYSKGPSDAQLIEAAKAITLPR